MVLYALMTLLAFTMILFDREDRVYLWMGTLFLTMTVFFAVSLIGSWSQTFSILQMELMTDGFLLPLISAGWTIVWWEWFERQRPNWLPQAAGVLAVIYMITMIIGEEMFTDILPHGFCAAFLRATMVVRLLFLLLQLWIVFTAIKREGMEGWLVLPSIVLWGVSTFTTEMLLLHIPLRWEIYRIQHPAESGWIHAAGRCGGHTAGAPPAEVAGRSAPDGPRCKTGPGSTADDSA